MKIMVIFLLALVISNPGFCSVVEEKKFSLEEKAEEVLVITDHQQGEIQIKGVETDRIKLTGHLEVYGEDQTEIRQFYEGVKVKAFREEGKVIIQISRPDLLSPELDHAIFLEILVPQEIDLDIKTGAGRVEIKEVRGNLVFQGAGAILEVRESSGNILAQGLKGGHIENFSGGKICLSSEQKVTLIEVEGEIYQEINNE